ncbi:MAG: SCO family protein [Tunicatimonas sp.]|uniref:SCO family protein n=1 Tax=Tunicatimonas sp. TaxID=1940096 RepID=UPI003C70D258
MKNLITITTICLSISGIYSCSAPSSQEAATLPIYGERYYDAQLQDTVYHQIANFAFVNQDSSKITPATFEDKIYVADFFFTSCPTICPIMKKEMLRVYEEFKDNEQVAILSHTIDPEYDTVGLLHDYAQRLGVDSDTWHFVTGNKDEIFDIGLKSYMVTAMEDEEAPGGRIHSGAFILVDKQRRIRGTYDGTVTEQVDVLINDIRRLLQKEERMASS